MKASRIFTLLYKEFGLGPRNFIFIFAIILPVILSLVISTVFGELFSGQARLGLVDVGHSQITALAQSSQAVKVKLYEDSAALHTAVAHGKVDVGLVLPAGFDQQLRSATPTSLKVYVWGESLLKHRITIVALVSDWLRRVAGQEAPVELKPLVLGDAPALSWQQRLLPFLVLMSVLFGGLILPASSLVLEKQHHTLEALLITPVTPGELYLAKGLMGASISMAMAGVTLLLNRAWGGNPLLLITLLGLGSLFAAECGVLMGILIRDLNSLFATIKTLGIVLYAPALIAMFPELPQHLARLFPTYYIVQPVLDVAQAGAGWTDVAGQLAILLGLMLLLASGLGLVSRRRR